MLLYNTLETMVTCWPRPSVTTSNPWGLKISYLLYSFSRQKCDAPATDANLFVVAEFSVSLIFLPVNFPFILYSFTSLGIFFFVLDVPVSQEMFEWLSSVNVWVSEGDVSR